MMGAAPDSLKFEADSWAQLELSGSSDSDETNDTTLSCEGGSGVTRDGPIAAQWQTEGVWLLGP
jgi:hypothetical protein